MSRQKKKAAAQQPAPIRSIPEETAGSFRSSAAGGHSFGMSVGCKCTGLFVAKQ
jgi:hypothetical protein